MLVNFIIVKLSCKNDKHGTKRLQPNKPLALSPHYSRHDTSPSINDNNEAQRISEIDPEIAPPYPKNPEKRRYSINHITLYPSPEKIESTVPDGSSLLKLADDEPDGTAQP